MEQFKTVLVLSLLLILGQLLWGKLLITEFSLSGLGDEQHRPWVEVYNNGPSPVSLHGWGIADLVGQDTAFQGSPQELLPGQYALVCFGDPQPPVPDVPTGSSNRNRVPRFYCSDPAPDIGAAVVFLVLTRTPGSANQSLAGGTCALCLRGQSSVATDQQLQLLNDLISRHLWGRDREGSPWPLADGRDSHGPDIASFPLLETGNAWQGQRKFRESSYLEKNCLSQWQAVHPLQATPGWHPARTPNTTGLRLSSRRLRPALGHQLSLNGHCLPETSLMLTVHNLRGNLVTCLLQTPSYSGPWHCSWDGRDSNGRLLPGGIYLIRLQLCNRMGGFRTGETRHVVLVNEP